MVVLDRAIDRNKGLVIEWALDAYEIKSTVDTGACWGVNGGYTFHALKHGELERAVLVDFVVTDLTRERATEYPQLEMIQGALGEQETVDKVGKVDAAIMYDILLHQVNPDWTEVLARYAENVDTLIIHNQCWLGAETIRFPDLAVEEYLERVYFENPDHIRAWYDRHDEMNDVTKKAHRDSPENWQWGITAKDLVAELWDLGYRIDFFHNHGGFDRRFPEIEVLSIIARKRHLS